MAESEVHPLEVAGRALPSRPQPWWGAPWGPLPGLGCALVKWEGLEAAPQTPAKGSGSGGFCTGVPESRRFAAALGLHVLTITAVRGGFRDSPVPPVR